jgi:hypothetical protein
MCYRTHGVMAFGSCCNVMLCQWAISIMHLLPITLITSVRSIWAFVVFRALAAVVHWAAALTWLDISWAGHHVEFQAEWFLAFWWTMWSYYCLGSTCSTPPTRGGLSSSCFGCASWDLEVGLPCWCHTAVVHVAVWVYHPRFSNHFGNWQEAIVCIHNTHCDIGVACKSSMDLQQTRSTKYIRINCVPFSLTILGCSILQKEKSLQNLFQKN